MTSTRPERLSRIARGVTVALLILAGLAAAPRQARAQRADDLSVVAVPRFDGWYDFGQWVEIATLVENTGPDTEVTLSIADGRTEFSSSVELPRGAVKLVPLTVMPNSQGRERLRLLVRRDGTTLTSRQVQLRPTQQEEIVAVVTDGDAAPDGVEDLSSLARAVVVRLGPRDLPERSLAWQSVDFIVVGGADLRPLTAAQQEALVQWVALGGQLVVTGGPLASTAVAGLPEALRPAQVAGVRDLDDFSALQAHVGGGPIDGSGVVADLEPAADAEVRVSAGQGTVPLVVSRRLGDGMVTILAFDPALPPLVDWGGEDALWRSLDRRGDLPEEAPPPDATVISEAISFQPDFELPSIRTTMLLIAGYIVLVGPVNYAVLRRRRRLDLAWVTIPVLTLAVGSLSYGVGYGLHGGDLLVQDLSVVRVIPDAGVAHVTTYVALFSPSDTEYDIDLSDGAIPYAAISFDPYGGNASRSGVVRSHQGAGSGVRGFGVDQWSYGGFAAQTIVSFDAADPGSLEVDGGAIKGVVRNPFGRSVVGLELAVHGSEQWIGSVRAGHEQDVSMTDTRGSVLEIDFDRGPRDGRDQQEQWHRTRLVRSALGQRNQQSGFGGYPGYYTPMGGTSVRLDPYATAVLFGFDESPALDVAVHGVSGRREPYTMYYAALPVADDTASAGIAGRIALDTPLSREMCGTWGIVPTAPGDVFELEFLVLPEDRTRDDFYLAAQPMGDAGMWGDEWQDVLEMPAGVLEAEPLLTIEGRPAASESWSDLGELRLGQPLHLDADAVLGSDGWARVRVGVAESQLTEAWMYYASDIWHMEGRAPCLLLTMHARSPSGEGRDG